MNPEKIGEPVPAPETEAPESKEPKERFLIGEEVTIKRTGGKMEGGWYVLNSKEGKDGSTSVVVIEKKSDLRKTVKQEDLLSWQPFLNGEDVPVLREVKPGGEQKLERKGWSILNKMQDGRFALMKSNEGGEYRNDAVVTKSELIKAKIVELNLRRSEIVDAGTVVAADQEILQKIDEDLEYWNSKLEGSQKFDEIMKRIKDKEPEESPSNGPYAQAETPETPPTKQ